MSLYYPVTLQDSYKTYKVAFEKNKELMRDLEYNTQKQCCVSVPIPHVYRDVWKGQFLYPCCAAGRRDVDLFQRRIRTKHHQNHYILTTMAQQSVMFHVVDKDSNFEKRSISGLFDGKEYVSNNDMTVSFYQVQFKDCSKVKTNIDNIKCEYYTKSNVDFIKGSGSVIISIPVKMSVNVNEVKAKDLRITARENLHIHYLTLKGSLDLEMCSFWSLDIDILDLSQFKGELFCCSYADRVDIKKIVNPRNIPYIIEYHSKPCQTNIPEDYLQGKTIVFKEKKYYKSDIGRDFLLDHYLDKKGVIVKNKVTKNTDLYIETMKDWDKEVISSNDALISQFGTKVITYEELRALALIGTV